LRELLIAGLLGCVSLLYATAGQAGGTAFLAVMAFTGFAATEMRPTALLLNIIAAGYTTYRLHQRAAIEVKTLLPFVLPSLVTAFVGGLLVLGRSLYFTLTEILLMTAAALMALRRVSTTTEARPIRPIPAALVGAGSGLLSGLTGVGGGVFLIPPLVSLRWATPRRAAALSPPFILCNSIVGFVGALLAGQRVAPGTGLYAVGALVGAMLGTAIGLRWMSERATRGVLAAILLLAGIRLLWP
jgi:uncharacterized membrane protein YfcA